MTRLRGLLVCVGGSLGLMASAAMAAPPVLDRVPDNALAVITLPNAENFQKNLSALMTAVESPFPLPEIKDLLAMSGITDGLDTTKGIAIVAFAPKKDADKPAAKKAADADKPAGGMNDEADEPEEDDEFEVKAGTDQVVILLPITKYEDLLANFGSKPGAAGTIDQVSMPTGEDGFVKDVGNGYAALSEDRELLARFEAKSGAGAIKGKLGRAGEDLSDRADLVAIVNVDAVRPMWPEIKKEMEAQIGEQAAMLPMDAGANPMENPAVMWFLDGAMRDGRAMVFGAKTGNKGLGLDMAVNFNDGSYMGKMFASGGKTSELMGKLPAGAYLLAGAIDTSSASIKQFIRDLSEKAMKPGAEAPMSVKTFEASEGQAFVMGLPRGGLIGGMMTGVIGYAKAKDTDAYVAAFKADMMAKDGDTEQGVTYKSSYVADGAKVGEVDVDVWDVKLTPDGSNAGAAQAMAMMFGPAGGPNGYVAQVDGGVYTTFSKSSELMGTALKTGKGEGENLGSDKLIGQVAQSLPGSRLAEGYLGMKGILDLVLPFAAMAGVQVPAEKIPENLPPVGMAISGQGGAAHFALFMPAPVIKAAVDIAMTVQGQMEGDMEEDEEVPAGGKGGTGQPRF